MNTEGQSGVFKRAMHLFDELCEMAPDEQRATLYQRCGDDDVLRERVEKMLREDASREGLLGVAGGGASALAESIAEGTPMPHRIGDYSVRREIGRGGMGVVYEAEQHQPRRRVALKVVHHSLLTPELRVRFERESEALGRLEHPGIARVYEAGSALVGTATVPYFAMELVDGRPLDEHVHEHQLGTHQVLELVARVCDAVQHAHQRGLIHRDLKPSNILVGTDESSTADPGTSAVADTIGDPKILDFGVARLIDADAQANTMHTGVGQLIGTLAYMSPEQVTGRSEDLDTRCDVYAIGITLYALLAGRAPHDLTGRTITDAARVVAEDDPRPLGSVVDRLRGDVDTIVSKAIDKDRERRYASAAELAQDIRRYLRDEPVLAHPPSTVYQMIKFAHRNKALVGGVIGTFVTLLTGVVVSGVLLAQVAEQRDAAELATIRSERVSQFQANLLMRLNVDDLGRNIDRIITAELESNRGNSLHGTTRQRSPFAAGGALETIEPTNIARAILADAVIGRAVDLADSSYADDPAVEADIRAGLGDILRELGRYDDAVAQLEIAAARHRESRGPDHEKTIYAEIQLTLSMIADERFAEVAELVEHDLLDRCQRLFGTNDRRTIRAASRLGRAYRGMGRPADAERVLAEALGWARASGALDLVRMCLNELGALAVYGDDPDRAIQYYDEYFDIAEVEQVDESNSEIIAAMNNLMAAMFKAGRLEDAERIARRSVPLFVAEHGDQHPRSMAARNNHARVLLDLDRPEEALELLAADYALALDALDEHNGVRQSVSTNLIDALLALERPAEAESVAEDLLADRREARSARPSRVAQTLEQLGTCQLELAEFEDAEASFTECLTLRESVDADHWLTHRARGLMGLAIARRGRLEEGGELVAMSTGAIVSLQDSIPENVRSSEIADARDRQSLVQLLSDRATAPLEGDR